MGNLKCQCKFLFFSPCSKGSHTNSNRWSHFKKSFISIFILNFIFPGFCWMQINLLETKRLSILYKQRNGVFCDSLTKNCPAHCAFHFRNNKLCSKATPGFSSHCPTVVTQKVRKLPWCLQQINTRSVWELFWFLFVIFSQGTYPELAKG